MSDHQAAHHGVPAWAIVTGLLLAAVNLRTAVTSVGPVLDHLHDGIGLTSTLAGVLTTLPVLSFAALGSLTPKLVRRIGAQQTLAGALALMTLGLALRAVVDNAYLFLLLSVAALAGGAMGNVLLPTLVKLYFPLRVGPMTAAYTTSMALGTTAAAGVTVPLANLRDPMDWRFGLGAWSVLALLGLAAALLLPRRRVRDAGQPPKTRINLRHSRTAWALAVFFGAQSLQAYVQFGWFALFFTERAGFSAGQSGALVAVLAGLTIPMSMAIPSIAAHLSDHRALIGALIGLTAVGYVGMLTAPRAGAWLWVVLAGAGAGSFPLALTLIGLRTRHVSTTASLSAFAQSIGYLIAGTGPLLVGVLHGVTGGWKLPFVLLFADLALMAAAGWVIGRDRYVEDDLTPSGAVQA